MLDFDVALHLIKSILNLFMGQNSTDAMRIKLFAQNKNGRPLMGFEMIMDLLTIETLLENKLHI